MIKKYFTGIIKTELTSIEFEKARKFAQEVTSTTNYSDSNQIKKQKIEDDHFVSKIGEEAARKVLSNYASVIGPDYRIFIGKNKSWVDDLYIDGEGLAVKTQRLTTGKKFGISWTFQAGTFRRDTILDRPEAWVVFILYDDINGNSFDLYPLMQIRKLKFKDPVLPYLKGQKLVVYKDTLQF